MPLYELDENEAKVIEERRKIAEQQSGFCKGLRAAIDAVHGITPRNNDEHQMLMDLVRTIKQTQYPEAMRLGPSMKDGLTGL